MPCHVVFGRLTRQLQYSHSKSKGYKRGNRRRCFQLLGLLYIQTVVSRAEMVSSLSTNGRRADHVAQTDDFAFLILWWETHGIPITKQEDFAYLFAA